MKILKKFLSLLFGTKAGNNQKTNNANKVDYSEKNIAEIPNTPFVSVKRGENDYVIVFGKHMISDEVFESHEKAKEGAMLVNWQMILNVVGIYTHEVINSNKLNEYANS